MIDMENAITHLQIISTWASFARERDLQFFTAKHLKDIAQWADDAIVLLKAQQEAYKPKRSSIDEGEEYVTSWWYLCGYCGKDINYHDRFCRCCGHLVKWD